MRTIQISILDPKANKLLEGLADLDLIRIEENPDKAFMAIVRKLRAKAAKKPPTLAEITKEVEMVRAARYANSKTKGRR